MAFITFFTGALLVVAGGGALYAGFDITTTERGIAWTISGTTAICAGFILISLGLIVLQLKKIVKTMESQLNIKLAENLSLKSLHDNYSSAPNIAMEDIKPPAQPDKNVLAGSSNALAVSLHSGGVATAGLAAVGAALASSTLLEPSNTDNHTFEKPLIDEAKAVEKLPELTAQHNVPELYEHALSMNEHPVEIHPELEFITKADPIKLKEVDDLDQIMEKFEIENIAPHDPIISKPETVISAFEAELRTKTEIEPEHHEHSIQSAEMDYEQDLAQDEFLAQTPPTTHSEIIGTYESAGVTYTLYAEGGVSAKAGDVTEHYPSLEELKAAFENGKSAFSA